MSQIATKMFSFKDKTFKVANKSINPLRPVVSN